MYMCIFACLFQDDPLLSKYKRLNEVIVGVVEDYSLVNFIPLNVQVTTQSLFYKASSSASNNHHCLIFE